jgi:hypothetical protein
MWQHTYARILCTLLVATEFPKIYFLAQTNNNEPYVHFPLFTHPTLRAHKSASPRWWLNMHTVLANTLVMISLHFVLSSTVPEFNGNLVETIRRIRTAHQRPLPPTFNLAVFYALVHRAFVVLMFWNSSTMGTLPPLIALLVNVAALVVLELLSMRWNRPSYLFAYLCVLTVPLWFNVVAMVRWFLATVTTFHQWGDWLLLPGFWTCVMIPVMYIVMFVSIDKSRKRGM